MPWDIDNYYVLNNRILQVEISIPLIEFQYVDLDDITDAWFEVLSQFISEDPEFEISWEIEVKGDNALVTIRVAKCGELDTFNEKEVRSALSTADALFDVE
jgi:hypothetical protein